MTSFLSEHPGGELAILTFAGGSQPELLQRRWFLSKENDHSKMGNVRQFDDLKLFTADKISGPSNESSV